MKSTRLQILCLGLIVFFLVSSGVQARPKTDQVFLKNGDRITCEIKDLALGLLKVKTDSLGTLDVRWQDIDRVVSQYQYEVHLSNGQIQVGSIQTIPDEGVIQIENLYATTEVDHMAIVALDHIGERFWNKLSGSLDVGLSYLRAGRRSQATINTEVEYREEKNTFSTKLDSLLTGQEEADVTARHAIDLGYTRTFKKNWFAFGLGQFTSNRELDLDLRSLAGGGVGRALIWTNRWVFAVRAGASYSNEKYFDQEAQNNAEGILGANFKIFRLDSPKMDISTSYTFIPNFVTKGRFRSEFDAKARFELIKDFYWSVSAFSSYDNRPPGSDAAETGDFGIVTSVGWSFNR